MMRRVFILLLHMHPRAFKQRFGDEMLGIFDQSAEKRSLMVDGILSLLRQWTLRRPQSAFSNTVTPDGVPMFYSGEAEVPPTRALMPGAVITLLFFAAISFVMSHRWQQTGFIIGSHHPSPSHVLPVRTVAQPVEELPSEVKMAPYPSHPEVSPYFRLLLVLGALDVDQDNILSAAEIENAPAALWTLDRNHDGKLTAEECGLKPDSKLDRMALGRARLNFMRIHPVLAVLDANQDGEISESEIRNATAALRTLDTNKDGKLVLRELLPDRATAMAASVMEMFDKNGDGKITRDEKPAAFAEGLLDRADRDGKGFVTEEDLVKELAKRRP
jgi:Ca2+-binding EF-hand superfamily protein